MTRPVTSSGGQDNKEDGEDEFSSRPSSHNIEGRRSDQKSNVNRSKHSETEQRRRSKINERFQVLRDLIPQNDQKRDKASFLLEVIQYIQFLQEKLQMYEGMYQTSSSGPSKLIPWRGTGAVDSFIDQSQLVKDGSIDDCNNVFASSLLNAQSLVESDVSGSTVYNTINHDSAALASCISEPLLPNLFDDGLAQPSSFPETEPLPSQTRLLPCSGRSYSTECINPSDPPNEHEELKTRLQNNLTRALGSSGVDMSKTSISVQLDVRKRTIGAQAKDRDISPRSQEIANHNVGSNGEDHNQSHKRLRTD